MRSTFISVVILALLSLTGVSFSLTPVSSCMDISSADVYQLTANLQGAPMSGGFATCLNVISSNVIIDCNGYNITNDGTADPTAGIYMSSGNVTVVNCNISGYRFASYVVSSGNTFINNVFSNSSSSEIRFVASTGNNLTNNTAYGSGSTPGFDFDQISDGNTVTNNIAYNNSQGIIVSSSSNCNLSGNTVFNNSQHGIFMETNANPGMNVSMRNEHYYNNAIDLWVHATANPFSMNASGLIFDNPAGNYQNFTNLSFNSSLAAASGFNISWASRPIGFNFVQKTVGISATYGSPTLDSIVWSWAPGELTGYQEGRLELWKYNGTWNLMNESPNLATHSISLSSLSSFSDFAILQTTCPVISSAGNYQLMRNSTGSPIDLGAYGTACIYLGASDVTLDCAGFNITNNGTAGTTAAILLTGTIANVTIKNCAMASYSRGLYSLNSDVTGGLITNNSAYNNSNGFFLSASNNNVVADNRAYNNTPNCGFWLDSGSTGNNLTSNTAYNNSFGFYLDGAVSNRLGNNTAYNSSTDAFALVSSSDNNVLFNNSAYGNTNHGFSINWSNGNTLANNTAYYNFHGFDAFTSDNNRLSDNIAYNNSYAVYFDNCSDNNLTGNRAYNNSAGIRFNTGSDNNFTSNQVYGNGAWGFYIYTDPVLINNTAYNNGNLGFYVVFSAHAVLINNTAYNHGYGFQLGACPNTTFVNNTAFNNPTGFYFEAASSGSLITGNRAYNSTANGFAFEAGSGDCNVTNNSAYNNSYGFNLHSDSNRLTNNLAFNNSNSGFLLNVTDGNALSGNSACNNTLSGFNITSSSAVTLSGNTACGGSYAISVNGSEASVSNDHYYDSAVSLLLVNDAATINLSRVIFDNPAGGYANFTNLSLNSSVGDAESYSIAWSSNSSPIQAGYSSFAGKFLNVTLLAGSPSIDSIVWAWTPAEVSAGGYSEARFRLWKYNGTWNALNLTPDAVAHTLSLSNLAGFSTFGILQLDDLSAPNVTLNLPANNTFFNSTTVRFNFTVTDDMSPVLSCYLYIDGTLNMTNASTQNGTLTTFTTGVGTGSHTWYVRCNDGVNNGTSATRNVIVDLTPPAVTLNSPADNATSTSSTMTFSFTAVDNLSATMSCTLYIDAVAAQANGDVANDTATAFIASGIANGNHNWSVACADNATNAGYSETRNFTVLYIPHDGDGDGDTTPVLDISITPVCGGYTVTVESEGARVPAALVSVYVGGREVETGYTNNIGEITFVGCDMDVEVEAAKSGMQGSRARFVPCVACPECVIDADCAANQVCTGGTCTPVECGCGMVENHACQPYECCADADCGQGEVCESHQCVPGGCLSDSDCTDSQRCEKAAGAARGHCAEVSGECGQAINHAWVKYMCGEEAGCDRCPAGSNCTGHVCVPQLGIHAPDTGFVGTGVNVTITEGTGRCRNCEVSWTSPSGKAGVGRTDANGNLLIPLNEKGQYKVVIVRDPAKAAFVTSLPKPVQPGEGQPVGILDALAPYFLWLLVLLLVIIGVVLYQRRRSGTRSKPAK